MSAADITLPATPRNETHRRAVRIWLAVLASMVVAMVVLGGATRLTNSGLSIVEWKPITGAVPPLSDAQWQSVFAKYRAIPQYEVLNKGMSLEEFKVIYWWEWSHRQLGRLIGIVFLLPLSVFWARGILDPRLKAKLVALGALGASQGGLGWWMVASGLSERTDVSQYRLALHMTLASIILVAILWVERSLGTGRPAVESPPFASRLLAYALVPLVLLQIFLGGLVAGLDAGLSHNTWPLIDGHFIPPSGDLWIMRPAWANHFENALTVQFQHRLLAYGLLALTLWHAVALRGRGAAGRRAWAVLAITLVQAAIGIATLLLGVPLWAGLLHQGGAIVLLAMVTVHASAIARNAPVAAGPRLRAA
jgi:heme a synthase